MVVVGVTGCIAAYKACELVRALKRSGCRVKVVMTEAATRFVGPITFRALTGEEVAVSMWDEAAAPVHHVSLADEADVIVLAPATANTLAKIASGRADDLLTTTVLASTAPLVIAPAMNVRMWRAAATEANLAVLRARGAVVVEPESGELACGEVGEGRLAPVAAIAQAVLAEVGRAHDLGGVRVLVTAGPTYEPIDAVRFIGNASSGKTGFALAEEAARRGAEVTLVTGPVALPDAYGTKTIRVTTAMEMREAVLAAYGTTDAVIATAAVSDLRAATPVQGKIKKQDAPDVLHLERNPDILAELGGDKDGRVLVGFAAETEDVLGYARSKLEAKSLDLIVANDVSVPGLGFGSDINQVWFVSPEGVEELDAMGKRAIACALWDRVSSAARDAADRRRKPEND